MPQFEIEELPIPSSIDGKEGDDFRAVVAARNAVQSELYGGPDLEYTPEELFPRYLDEFEPKRLVAARVDGRIVARAVYETQPHASDDVAWYLIEVIPEFRGRGIGAALYASLEDFADADGRPVRQAFAFAKDVPGERLPAPTGFGSVPLAAPGTRFLQNRGWALEQVARCSKLVLPAEHGLLERMLAEAQEAAGSDYRVLTWVGRTPEEWLEDRAMLSTRMSTDAPAADLAVDEDVWTAERVRADEDAEESSPRTMLTAAVEHIPSGRLAGFTQLSAPAELGRAVSQEDTIVLREHRGHRLGMLLKVANLLLLEETEPGHPSVVTFNAEENRHMLSVNEAVGFVPVGYEGAWKRVAGSPGP